MPDLQTAGTSKPYNDRPPRQPLPSNNTKQATHVRPDSSTPRRAALDLRVLPKALLRERVPQIAVVLAAGEHLVRLDDRVARVEERRAALLQLHPVEHELHAERVAVRGHERLLLASSVELARAVELADGNGAVRERRRGVECVGVSVLGDQALRDDPEDLRPDFADGVNAPVAGLVEGLVRRGIDGVILKKPG